MSKVKMKMGDLLIVDPGYIRSVKGDFGGPDEERFDGLKHVKTLHEGDDGEYEIYHRDTKLGSLGVDSGRIWVLKAEFEIVVDVDSGLSGYFLIENTTGKDLDEKVWAKIVAK